jgi:hypothetical protein
MNGKWRFVSGLLAASACLFVTAQADAGSCVYSSQTWGEFHHCNGKGLVWGEWVLNDPPPGGITQPVNQILHAYNAGAIHLEAYGVDAWGSLVEDCNVIDNTYNSTDEADSTGCFWAASTYYMIAIW